MLRGRTVDRKLAAILSAHVVGFSRLTALDEEGTIRVTSTARRSRSGFATDFTPNGYTAGYLTTISMYRVASSKPVGAGSNGSHSRKPNLR